MKTVKRVAIYARVSTAGHNQDTGLQLDELHQVAHQRGWTITQEFIDEGVSGSTKTRPALDKMMKAAREGKVDLVAVWKLDRLGRSLQHLLALLDELTSLGVGFVSLRDAGIDTTSPTGRLMLQLIGAFAEYEKALIQERVIAGVRRAQRQGKHCGRPVLKFNVQAARDLLAADHTVDDVATIMGVSESTLRRHLRQNAPVKTLSKKVTKKTA